MKKCKNFKFLACLVCSTAAPLTANTGAWVQPAGEYYSAEGAYYAFPVKSNNSVFIPGAPSSKATIGLYSSRASATSELRYGLHDSLTLFTKIDAGFVSDQYRVEVDTGSAKSDYEFVLEYTSIKPEFGFQKIISEENGKTLSFSSTLFPGEYIISKSGDYFTHDQAAIEARLLFGTAWEEDINFFNILGGEGSKRWHYFDTQMAIRNFLYLENIQWDFEMHMGVRPADKWLFIGGMYNTFIGSTYFKKPFNNSSISSLVSSTGLTSPQKIVLKDALLNTFEQESTFNNHQLNLKVSYEIAPKKNISLEGLTNFITRKPFENNTLVLTYDVAF